MESWRAVWAVAVGVLVLSAILVWFAWERCGLRGCPDVELLQGYVPAEASVVVDRRGEELTKLYRVRRIVISLDSLPQYVPAAFVAIEDREFWDHDGVDWSRVLGAAWTNLRALRIEEGFSTITMQLARNLFPERLPGAQQTLSRKLGEMRVAMQIEDRYTKQQILELYLNQIYFGEGAWGIEAAAHEYFGKPASQLTLSEAALLAGVPRAPSRLNPRVDPEGAVARRNLVLRRMVNQGWVDEVAAAEARTEALELERSRIEGEAVAPYFVQEVRRLLETELGESIYTGGYTIYTTLDRDVQRVSERELAQQIEAIEAGQYGRFRHSAYRPAGAAMTAGGTGNADAAAGPPRTPYLQGAVVMLDVRTGDVLALVGGRDFGDSKYNRATQAARQPGSAFKPFVYAAAIDAGYPLTFPLEDTPYRVVLESGQVWAPQNYGGSYAGVVTTRDALVRSKNVATVRLANAVGIERVIEMAEQLGIEGPIPAWPSIALGAKEVALLELTAAYAVFATLGQRTEPRFVTRVEDRAGRIVWQQLPRVERVLNPAVAFLVTDVLRDVVDRGTGKAVRGAGYSGVVAGKTGTTNDARNVWFVGFTPQRALGIWIGFDRPQTIVAGATGGRLAAPVWGRIMRQVGPDPGEWARPPGIEVRLVDQRGAVVSPGCPAYGAVRQEYFIAGTVPYSHCLLGRPFGRPDTLGWPGARGWPDTLAPFDTAGALGPDDGDGADDEGRGGWRDRMRRRFIDPDDPEDRADDPPSRAPRGDPREADRLPADTLRLEPSLGERPQDETDSRSQPGSDTEPRDSTRGRRSNPPNLLGRPLRPPRREPRDGDGSR